MLYWILWGSAHHWQILFLNDVSPLRDWKILDTCDFNRRLSNFLWLENNWLDKRYFIWRYQFLITGPHYFEEYLPFVFMINANFVFIFCLLSFLIHKERNMTISEERNQRQLLPFFLRLWQRLRWNDVYKSYSVYRVIFRISCWLWQQLSPPQCEEHICPCW